MKITILGLSVTSSWGNGHATNYRALLRAMEQRGHDVVFLERDVPWYAEHRDLPDPPHGRTVLYDSLGQLEQHRGAVAQADLVLVGSYVPEGTAVAGWALGAATGVTAFYDIDTPVTLAGLERGTCEYLEASLLPRFDLYLSFTGGPTLDVLSERHGVARPRAFHCLVDPDAYRPAAVDERWHLGYLGTYSEDRQPALDQLLVEPARRRPDLRFVVAGPMYPDTIVWPANVDRIEHLPPAAHSGFYAAQRFTLNITRADMVRAGWSPSVRLFEAGACAVPVVSDRWEGLHAFFADEEEILVASGPDDVLRHLDGIDRGARDAIGRSAQRRVLAEHTAEHRVVELEAHVAEVVRAGESRGAPAARPDVGRPGAQTGAPSSLK